MGKKFCQRLMADSGAPRNSFQLTPLDTAGAAPGPPPLAKLRATGGQIEAESDVAGDEVRVRTTPSETVAFSSETDAQLTATSLTTQLTARYLCLHHDLTESLVHTDKNLCSSLKSLKGLPEIIKKSLEGFLAIVTITGKLLYISESVQSLLGLRQLDNMGHSFLKVIHPDDHESVLDRLLQWGEQLVDLESLKGDVSLNGVNPTTTANGVDKDDAARSENPTDAAAPFACRIMNLRDIYVLGFSPVQLSPFFRMKPTSSYNTESALQETMILLMGHISAVVDEVDARVRTHDLVDKTLLRPELNIKSILEAKASSNPGDVAEVRSSVSTSDDNVDDSKDDDASLLVSRSKRDFSVFLHMRPSDDKWWIATLRWEKEKESEKSDNSIRGNWIYERVDQRSTWNTGYLPQEFSGQPFEEFVHLEDRDSIVKILHENYESLFRSNEEKRPNTTVIWRMKEENAEEQTFICSEIVVDEDRSKSKGSASSKNQVLRPEYVKCVNILLDSDDGLKLLKSQYLLKNSPLPPKLLALADEKEAAPSLHPPAPPQPAPSALPETAIFAPKLEPQDADSSRGTSVLASPTVSTLEAPVMIKTEPESDFAPEKSQLALLLMSCQTSGAVTETTRAPSYPSPTAPRAAPRVGDPFINAGFDNVVAGALPTLPEASSASPSLPRERRASLETAAHINMPAAPSGARTDEEPGNGRSSNGNSLVLELLQEPPDHRERQIKQASSFVATNSFAGPTSSGAATPTEATFSPFKRRRLSPLAPNGQTTNSPTSLAATASDRGRGRIGAASSSEVGTGRGRGRGRAKKLNAVNPATELEGGPSQMNLLLPVPVPGQRDGQNINEAIQNTLRIQLKEKHALLTHNIAKQKEELASLQEQLNIVETEQACSRSYQEAIDKLSQLQAKQRSHEEHLTKLKAEHQEQQRKLAVAVVHPHSHLQHPAPGLIDPSTTTRLSMVDPLSTTPEAPSVLTPSTSSALPFPETKKASKKRTASSPKASKAPAPTRACNPGAEDEKAKQTPEFSPSVALAIGDPFESADASRVELQLSPGVPTAASPGCGDFQRGDFFSRPPFVSPDDAKGNPRQSEMFIHRALAPPPHHMRLPERPPQPPHPQQHQLPLQHHLPQPRIRLQDYSFHNRFFSQRASSTPRVRTPTPLEPQQLVIEGPSNAAPAHAYAPGLTSHAQTKPLPIAPRLPPAYAGTTQQNSFCDEIQTQPVNPAFANQRPRHDQSYHPLHFHNNQYRQYHHHHSPTENFNAGGFNLQPQQQQQKQTCFFPQPPGDLAPQQIHQYTGAQRVSSAAQEAGSSLPMQPRGQSQPPQQQQHYHQQHQRTESVLVNSGEKPNNLTESQANSSSHHPAQVKNVANFADPAAHFFNPTGPSGPAGHPAAVGSTESLDSRVPNGGASNDRNPSNQQRHSQRTRERSRNDHLINNNNNQCSPSHFGFPSSSSSSSSSSSASSSSGGALSNPLSSASMSSMNLEPTLEGVEGLDGEEGGLFADLLGEAPESMETEPFTDLDWDMAFDLLSS